MPRKKKLQEWEEELIDLGWEREKKRGNFAAFHYYKETTPDTLLVTLYDYDGTGGIYVVGRRTYKILECTYSYPSIHAGLVRFPPLLGKGTYISAWHAIIGTRCGEIFSPEGSSQIILSCWGTLPRKVENIKRLPELLKTRQLGIRENVMSAATIGRQAKFEGLKIEQCEMVF